MIVSPIDYQSDALVETLIDELNACKAPMQVFMVADRIDQIARKMGTDETGRKVSEGFDSIQWAFIKENIRSNMTRCVERSK